MTINEGFLGQNTDGALNKGSFSQGALGAAGVTTQVLGPGPGNAVANVASHVPTLGDMGVLVPAGVPFSGPIVFAPAASPGLPVPGAPSLPSVLQTLSKLAVTFLGSSSGGDAAKTATFTLWVQRQTLLNPSDVANGGIPTYGPPVLAPVATSITSSPVNVAALAGGLPTELFLDFSYRPLDVVAGDVYYLSVTFSAALVGTITNVMVSLG